MPCTTAIACVCCVPANAALCGCACSRLMHRNSNRHTACGATVIIQSPGHDQYDRLLGDAWCDGRNVNEEMVAAGAAWPYERYVEDRRLFRLQDQARERKVGLWAAKAPQKPWVWRAEQRNRR